MGVRCLIVDDSEEFVASAARLLESQGMRIVGNASSGGEALLLLETLAPDVVLVDIELGGEDGVELTHALTARAPSACVILISAYDQDELGDLIADSPAAGFLPKHAVGADAIAGLMR